MNKIVFHIFLISFLLFPLLEQAQSLKLVRTVPLLDRASSVSIDRTSNILIADNKGNVHKYDAEGDLAVTYSPDRPGNIKNIEAWSALNILVFYEDLQEYRFLDRFLVLTSTNRLDQNIFARLMTQSSDNNLWIVDDKDYSLKKLNILYQSPEIVTPLPNIIGVNFDGRFMKEYQNRVFLSDFTTGIYVFDNFGNYIRTLPLVGVSYFNFIENELYFLKDDVVTFYDIYTGESRKMAVPAESNYLYALASKNRLYLISAQSLDIYALDNRE